MENGFHRGLSGHILRLIESLGRRGSTSMTRPMLHAYFDESGKFHDKDTISFCGWITPMDGWEKLSIEWDALLAKHRDHVHMADLMAFRDEFEPLKTLWGPTKRDAVLREFAEIIQKYAGFGILAALDTKHFRGMSQSFRAKIKNPHYAVFRLALNLLLDKVEHDVKTYGFTDVNVSIICDHDTSTSSECWKHLLKFRQIDARARER